MAGAGDGPEVLFAARQPGLDDAHLFWASDKRPGRFAATLTLYEASTGKVLLRARAHDVRQRFLSWDVRAGNDERVISVQATRRRKYGPAGFKLTVYTAYRSEPGIKMKPELDDPERLVLWAVTGRKQKAQEGQPMAEATYSSYDMELPEGALSSSSGSDSPSPLFDLPDVAPPAAADASADAAAPGGDAAVASIDEAAAASGDDAGSATAGSSSIGACSESSGSSDQRRRRRRRAAWPPTAPPRVGPGECCATLHPRANPAIVAVLLAIHRFLLVQDWERAQAKVKQPAAPATP